MNLFILHNSTHSYFLLKIPPTFKSECAKMKSTIKRSFIESYATTLKHLKKRLKIDFQVDIWTMNQSMESQRLECNIAAKNPKLPQIVMEFFPIRSTEYAILASK